MLCCTFGAAGAQERPHREECTCVCSSAHRHYRPLAARPLGETLGESERAQKHGSQSLDC
ncbi:hypothetical protein T484DRAFT_1936213 [Baffinella frigidus]|nr:hypothetical protein T484DRAFT_1936213 [Cryptophyta sp. CCMP2293]